MRLGNPSRILLVIIFSLVTLIFLIGVIQTFSHARAAVNPTTTPAVLVINAQEVSPTPQKTPIPKSADTTGIIALSIVIVAVILVGATWGRRNTQSKNLPKKD